MTTILKILLNELSLKILNKIHNSKILSTHFSIISENLYAKARKIPVRFATDQNGNLFAQEVDRKLQISNKIRGFWLYRDGIQTREDFIFKSYCLQNIKFIKEDIVFDCGANSGDLFLRLSKIIEKKNYFAFEPNPNDLRVLRENIDHQANIFNLALGNTDSNLSFFVSTANGDSSLVEPKNWTEKIEVTVARLDSFIDKQKIKSIKLLKIEAEGFEPEILEGLGDKIRHCEYIAVDGGYERGVNCEQTMTTCINYLVSKGYKIIDIYFPWHRALFQRQ